jgi:hypothetical protein
MMIIIKIIMKMVPSGGTSRVLRGEGGGQKSIGSILYAAARLRRLEAATESFAAARGIFQATAGHVRESRENIH